MKFNISDPLFKIETNAGFNVKKISKGRVFIEALRYFNMKKKYSLYLINKKTSNSKIYFVRSKKNNFVLRSSTSQDSKYLEAKSSIKIKKKIFYQTFERKKWIYF